MTVPVSARVPKEINDRLTTLAQVLRRSRSDLIEEAIRVYVESESEFLSAVERGRAEARAGQVTDHDRVMADLDALIEGV